LLVRVERGGGGDGGARAVGRFLRVVVFVLVVCFLLFLLRLRVRGAEAERFLVGFARVFFRLVVGRVVVVVFLFVFVFTIINGSESSESSEIFGIFGIFGIGLLVVSPPHHRGSPGRR
jgi:hypothetical protein